MANVSVIIPCYNHAAYIGETIESVLAQTHLAAEIIVVDDGSQDTSAAVAEQYAQAHPTVRLIRQMNAGRSAAANHGLRESQGDFLVFLDADDRLLPHALAMGLEQLAAHPEAALAAGQCRFIDANGLPMETPRPTQIAGTHYEQLLNFNFIWNQGNVLFRRSAVEAVGGFNTDVRHAEDYDIYLRIARGATFACYDEDMAEYRQHPNNKSKSAHTSLVTLLQILENEKAIASRSPETQRAWQAGIENMKMIYGERCIEQLPAHLRSGDNWGRAWATFKILVRHYPRGFLRYLKNRVKARIRRPVVSSVTKHL